jgi:predicted transcriptional regulator YdeE
MIKVEEFAGRIVLGLRADFISIHHENSNAHEVIGPLWGQMSQRFFALELPGAEKAIGVGAMWNTDSGVPGEMTYFAGYEVESVPDELGGLEVLRIPTGRFAYVTHRGPLQALGETVSEFYTKSLPESGIARREGMDLEIYQEIDHENSTSTVIVAAPVN